MNKLWFKWDFWIRNHPVSKVWDTKLNYLMDTGVRIVKHTLYTFVFEDGTEVWGANFPYGFGSPYDRKWKEDVLPYRRTVIKFLKYLKSQGHTVRSDEERQSLVKESRIESIKKQSVINFILACSRSCFENADMLKNMLEVYRELYPEGKEE